MIRPDTPPNPHAIPVLHQPYRFSKARQDEWAQLIGRVRAALWIAVAGAAGFVGGMFWGVV